MDSNPNVELLEHSKLIPSFIVHWVKIDLEKITEKFTFSGFENI
jgi:hypothetical protein